MKKFIVLMAIMLMASSAYAVSFSTYDLNLVVSYDVDDGEGVGYDPITGGFVTTDSNETDLRFYDSSGVFQSALTVLPTAANPARLVACDVLPTGNIMVTDRNDGFTVYEVDRATGNQITASVVPAGMTYPYGMDVDGATRWAGDKTAKDVQMYDASWTPVGASWNADTQAGLGGAGVDAVEGLGVGPNGNIFVADDAGGRVVEFQTDGTFVAEYDTGNTLGGSVANNDPEGISTDGTHLYVAHDSGSGAHVAKYTILETVHETPDAMTFDDEYMVIGTSDNAGGDAIYRVNANGTLTFLNNIGPASGAPNACRSAYLHEVDDTLYFTDGNDNIEFQVGLADVIANGVAAASAADVTIWNTHLGGAESNPSHIIKGPQDGKMYAVAGGAGWMWQFEDGTPDVLTKETFVGGFGPRHMLVVYGNKAYMKDGDDDFFVWTQAGDGSWSEKADGGPGGVLGAAALDIRKSDGMFFSGRSGLVQFGYIEGDKLGELWKLDPVRNGQAYNSLEVSADGTKLWVGFPQMVGYYDISGPYTGWGNSALWTTVYSDFGLEGLPPGLTGTDWRISIIATNVQLAEGPIPEPAGLGLVGLALLAMRRRRS